MSWSATVQLSPADAFDEAVDTCASEPQEDALADEPKAQLHAAREAAKELAAVLDVDEGSDKGLTASLSGHACTEGESGLDSISVSVRQAPLGA
jgi:hypothetical protein